MGDAKHPPIHRAALATKNYLVQNVNGAKVENPNLEGREDFGNGKGVPAGIRKS